MKRIMPILAAALLACFLAQNTLAQSATDTTDIHIICPGDDGDQFTLKWWGVSGQTYFLQDSYDYYDLQHWRYVQGPEFGEDEVIEIGVNGYQTSPIFFRVFSTETYTTDPYYDADGDRYPDVYEAKWHTDPFDPGSFPNADFSYVDDDGIDLDTSDGFFVIPTSGKNVADVLCDAYDWYWDGHEDELPIIFVEPGTYSGDTLDRSSQSVICPENFMLISKEGPVNTVFDFATTNGFTLTSAGDTVVNGITFRNPTSADRWHVVYAQSALFYGSYFTPDVTISDCIFDGHFSNCLGGTSKVEGAVVIQEGRLALTNCIFRNSQYRDVSCYGGSNAADVGFHLEIINCTFYRENTSSRGAVYLDNDDPSWSGPYKAAILNSILWKEGASAPVERNLGSYALNLYGYNSILKIDPGGWADSADLSFNTPDLAPTGFIINGNSPAIDAGITQKTYGGSGVLRAPPTDLYYSENPPSSGHYLGCYRDAAPDLGADEWLDTDTDALPDWWEVAYDLDPQIATDTDGANGDADSDGILNIVEFQNGLTPNLALPPTIILLGGKYQQGSHAAPGNVLAAPLTVKIMDGEKGVLPYANKTVTFTVLSDNSAGYIDTTDSFTWPRTSIVAATDANGLAPAIYMKMHPDADKNHLVVKVESAVNSLSCHTYAYAGTEVVSCRHHYHSDDGITITYDDYISSEAASHVFALDESTALLVLKATKHDDKWNDLDTDENFIIYSRSGSLDGSGQPYPWGTPVTISNDSDAGELQDYPNVFVHAVEIDIGAVKDYKIGYKQAVKSSSSLDITPVI